MTELSFAERLAYYLVERLGEAVGGAGLLAVVSVLIAYALFRNPEACIYAGILGAMCTPATHLLLYVVGGPLCV